MEVEEPIPSSPSTSEQEEEEVSDSGSDESTSLSPSPSSSSRLSVDSKMLKQLQGMVPVGKEDSLEYDMGNLAAFDYTSIDIHEFSQNPEKHLQELAQQNVQLLFNQAFALPTEPASVVGRIAILPARTTKLPREKPLPKAKELTRWQKFALIKGIENKKRGRMVWDEKDQKWAPRYGYGRANDQSREWVLEHNENDEDDRTDPWTKLAMEKKEKIAHNEKKRLRNIKEAQGQRVPGTVDLTSTFVAKKVKRAQKKERNTTHVDVALSTVQQSTASMGKFDDKRYKEPERKKEKSVKRDVDFQKSRTVEKEHSLRLLSKVMGTSGAKRDTGSVNMDVAVNRQQVAKETKASNKKYQAAISGSKKKKRKGKQ